MSLYVYFDGQFWRGIIQYGTASAFEHVFGAEPKDWEILDFVLETCMEISVIAPTEGNVDLNKPKPLQISPKRLKRIASRELSSLPPNKSFEAVKLQQEQNKKEAEKMSKERKEFLKAYKRNLKTLKAKDKHKGR